ncbi:DnaJ domain-containing protein [Xylaria digitata]|nr:DnaJ domain-containing protein [Xylaria digitata]
MGVQQIQPPTCVDYYADLGVSQSASAQEIRHAFYKLARETHPDKNGNESTHTARFRKAREAYECLGDVTRRSIYDSKYHIVRDEWARYRERINNQVAAPAVAEQRREDNFHLKMGGFPSACAEQRRDDNYHLKMGGGYYRLKVEVAGFGASRSRMGAASLNLDDFFARWQRTTFSFMSPIRC